MVARFAGASLGLLAFSITVIGGLFVENPVSVTLSRSIFALVVFCFLGLVLGSAAQRVVNEYESSRKEELRSRLDPRGEDAGSTPPSSPPATSRTSAGA